MNGLRIQVTQSTAKNGDLIGCVKSLENPIRITVEEEFPLEFHLNETQRVFNL